MEPFLQLRHVQREVEPKLILTILNNPRYSVHEYFRITRLPRYPELRSTSRQIGERQPISLSFTSRPIIHRFHNLVWVALALISDITHIDGDDFDVLQRS